MHRFNLAKVCTVFRRSSGSMPICFGSILWALPSNIMSLLSLHFFVACYNLYVLCLFIWQCLAYSDASLFLRCSSCEAAKPLASLNRILRRSLISGCAMLSWFCYAPANVLATTYNSYSLQPCLFAGLAGFSQKQQRVSRGAGGKCGGPAHLAALQLQPPAHLEQKLQQ